MTSNVYFLPIISSYVCSTEMLVPAQLSANPYIFFVTAPVLPYESHEMIMPASKLDGAKSPSVLAATKQASRRKYKEPLQWSSRLGRVAQRCTAAVLWSKCLFWTGHGGCFVLQGQTRPSNGRVIFSSRQTSKNRSVEHDKSICDKAVLLYDSSVFGWPGLICVGAWACKSVSSAAYP